MRAFTCLISDERYTAPTLSLFLVSDVERARELAVRDLAENPHHLRFDVHEGEALVFSLTRDEAGV